MFLIDFFGLDFRYRSSNWNVSLLDSGMTNRFRASESAAINAAATIYGRIILWKLTPHDRIATISEFDAIFDVKKMTVMNTNIGLYMLTKYGMKFR